jgi:hypothetical protein
VGFAAGGVLDMLPPGPVLAGFAAEAQADGLEQLEDSELAGVLCGWRRLASWAAAGEVAAVITLARRRAVQARQKKNPHLIEHVAAELAAALTLTGRAGDRLLSVSAGLARLEATMAALAQGRIDWPRAIVFVDELAALDDAGALAAQARVLPGAAQLTTGQLRAALRRAVLMIDPAAAGRRRRAARKDARVEVWDEPSGNAALAGRELPPAEMIAADQRLTAHARWLQAHGAGGTIDQLRAAVFTALLAGRPVQSLLPASPQPAGSSQPAGSPESAASTGTRPGPGEQSRAADLAMPGTTGPAGMAAGEKPPAGLVGSVHLIMPLAAWLGTSDLPGEIPGYGPADAGTCRDLAAPARTRPAGQRPAPVAAGPAAGEARDRDLRPPAREHGLPASRITAAPHRHPAANMLLPRLPPPGNPMRPRPHRAPRPGRPDLRMQPRADVQAITTQVVSLVLIQEGFTPSSDRRGSGCW